MKKFVFAVLTVSLLASCQKFELGEQSVTTSCWQSALPGSMPVCMVSLPGSHDAGTYSINTPVIQEFAKTQVISIARQWEYGVRVFDLRPAVVGGDLLICHGSFKTKTGFADALGSIVDALDKNPSEFAVVVIRHEGEADGNSDQWGSKMAECIGRLPASRVVRDFDTNMTVDQMRGRILFLFREDIADPEIGTRIYDWSSSDNIERQKAARIGEGTLWIQDYYDPKGADDKLSAIKNLMLDFSENSDSAIWCINHTSGYNPAIFGAPNYGSNAQNVNAETAKYISSLSGSVGFVVMDFAAAKRYKSFSVGGDVLIKAVIEHNPLATKVSFCEGVEVSED